MAAVKNLLFAPTVIPKLSVSFAIGNAALSISFCHLRKLKKKRDNHV